MLQHNAICHCRVKHNPHWLHFLPAGRTPNLAHRSCEEFLDFHYKIAAFRIYLGHRGSQTCAEDSLDQSP